MADGLRRRENIDTDTRRRRRRRRRRVGTMTRAAVTTTATMAMTSISMILVLVVTAIIRHMMGMMMVTADMTSRPLVLRHGVKAQASVCLKSIN